MVQKQKAMIRVYTIFATVWFVFGFSLVGRTQEVVHVYENIDISVWGDGDTVQIEREELVMLCRLVYALKEETKISDLAISSRDSMVNMRTRIAVMQADEMSMWRERVRVEAEMSVFYEKAWKLEKRGKAGVGAKWGVIGGVVGGLTGFVGGFILGKK